MPTCSRGSAAHRLQGAVRGFTLVELLMTVAIVAILASVAFPMAELVVQRTKEQDLRRALQQLREAIDAYKLAGDEGRIPRKVGESGYPPTLDVLVNGVVDVKSPLGKKIYFLRRIPRNPLVTDPDLPAAETWGTRSYASEANAPKAGDDVYDVFVKSDKVGLNGVPYREW